MRQRRLVGAICAAGIGLVLLFVLPAVLGSGGELDGLRADPIARWAPASEQGTPATPPTVEAEEEGSPSLEFYGPLPTLGDRDGAFHARTFLVPRADELMPFEAARRAAHAAGWRMDYPDYAAESSVPKRTWTSVRGRKALPTGDALVHITLDTAPELPGVEREALEGMNSLVIRLEHTR